MCIKDRLLNAWYAPRLTPLSALLWPAALAYGGAAALRRSAYRHRWLTATRLPVPVVVVGNVTLGGTGKTPLVRALVAALAARGFHPGIVSRGYGVRIDRPRVATPTAAPSEVGDEPAMLARDGFPVAVAPRRADAARALVAAHPSVDVIVADDGLQHYALARDFEIALIDVTRGFGNGLMLPAGPLREPVARLARVDAIVRRTDRDVRADADAHAVARQAADRHAGAGSRMDVEVPASAAEFDAGKREFTFFEEVLPLRNLAAPQRVADLANLPRGSVHAIAGIGDPARFFAALRRLGLEPVPHAFPDHHAYVAADLDFPGARAIVMTEKDAVKCQAFADERMWQLPIVAHIDPALVTLVEDRIRGSQVA